MLAARRSFTVLEEPFKTPLLVPSYSSRAVEEDVSDVIDATRNFVAGPILVSAYDVKHYRVRQRLLQGARLVFLDSGGYEAGSEADLSEIENPKQRRPRWSVGQHKEVLESWHFSTPTVVISYDEPYKRVRTHQQISRAVRGKNRFELAGHAILLKPEPLGRKQRKHERVFIDIDRIIGKLDEIRDFAIIGVTEKELGGALLTRMKNIAQLRKALDEANMDQPIHVFGSLDPVSTPLYFFSGADIFDGLTWLRYAYHDGLSMYRQNFAARDPEMPHDILDGQLALKVHVHNYFVIGRLQETMTQFLNDQNFDLFGPNAHFFQDAVQKLNQELGV